MAIYNTSFDAANTAVRSFLTAVGEHYNEDRFNTGNGKGKAIWEKIRQEFNGECAYCGKAGDLQIEHLVMFNRSEYGLHHPGNVVPVCSQCNKREKDSNKQYLSWERHLEHVCKNNKDVFLLRREKIIQHIKKYKYPDLTKEERHAIRVISQSLYENIKTEVEKSLDLYKELDAAFIDKKKG